MTKGDRWGLRTIVVLLSLCTAALMLSAVKGRTMREGPARELAALETALANQRPRAQRLEETVDQLQEMLAREKERADRAQEAADLLWCRLEKIRGESEKYTCINNLRQIDAAKEQWALESNQPAGARPTAADLDPYLKGGTSALFCPYDSAKTFATSYTIRAIGVNPECRIVREHSL